MKASRPSRIAAIVNSLSFTEDRRAVLETIPESAWPALLRLTDDARLTLALASRCPDYVPASVRERLDLDLANNALRYARLLDTYHEIAGTLHRNGIEFVVLKGFAQYWPYRDEHVRRPQYDLDLYCPPEAGKGAAEVICALGYEHVHSTRPDGTDHLPPLIRRKEWNWRGDYYDPVLPFSIEIHHRFWDAGREHFAVSGAESFWARRKNLTQGGEVVPALDSADALSYAAWHVVKHLLRGNLKLFHAFELAWFLHRSSADDRFWQGWNRLADPRLRVAESVAFRLAREWFGCTVHPVVEQAIDCMPESARRWFDLFGFSPVLGLEDPNKDELFLHLALTSRWSDRARILRRRILPMNPPRVASTAAAQARFLGGRLSHHVATLGPVLRSASRWVASGAASGD